MPLGAASSNYVTGVELLNGTRALPGYLPQPNSEYRNDYLGSETAGDNLRSQKGNSPDRRLRSPIHAKCVRKSLFCDSEDVGLEAATI